MFKIMRKTRGKSLAIAEYPSIEEARTAMQRMGSGHYIQYPHFAIARENGQSILSKADLVRIEAELRKARALILECETYEAERVLAARIAALKALAMPAWEERAHDVAISRTQNYMM